MTDTNPLAAERLQRRRFIEDEAIKLGAERTDLEDKLLVNTQGIIDRMREAAEYGIPLDTYSKMVKVSRQTLYRWRDGSG
jgi:hypothetical protein